MKLKKFIKKFVEHNSTVRLLTNVNGGHCIVLDDWDSVFMAHEIPESEYKDWEIEGVSSILITKGRHTDAVNVVVKDPNPYRNFVNVLSSDKDMIRAYKDNIAMAIKDNFVYSDDLHFNANKCAGIFIDNLIKKSYENRT